MARTLGILLLTLLWLSTAAFGQSGKTDKNLIPVKAAADESLAEQQQSRSTASANGPEAPTPAEQMYVFWYLGKVLSYPVDAVESYIRNWREAPKPVAVPASSSSKANPFESVKWTAIPPAPPVANDAGGNR
jgi:hypothetical protein